MEVFDSIRTRNINTQYTSAVWIVDMVSTWIVNILQLDRALSHQKSYECCMRACVCVCVRSNVCGKGHETVFSKHHLHHFDTY